MTMLLSTRASALRGAGVAVTVAVASVGFVAPAAAVVPVEPVPERSWTVNGRVFAVELAGDTVFVGGQFSAAISPTGQSVARRNLAAFRISDGSLVTGWRADAGGAVYALDADDGALYVGGFFTGVGGERRERIAKVSVTTGDVDGAFRPSLNAGVRGIDAEDGSVYVGGHFNTVDGATRNRLVKLDADTGAVDTGFAASANYNVWSVRKNPASPVLYAAGQFSVLSGASRAGLGGVSSVTGQPSGPVFANTTRPQRVLDVSSDGSRLYSGADSNAVTSWRTSDGVRVWRHYAMGNVQAVHYSDGLLYFGFHDGFQNDLTVKVLAANALNGALELDFRPRITDYWGVYGIAASDRGLVIGGDYQSVVGVTARGWARFMPR